MSIFKNLFSKTILRDLSTGRFERGYNYVSLVGRVGSPPKVGEKNSLSEDMKNSVGDNNDEFVVFSLGTSRYLGRNEDNKINEATDWHRIFVDKQYLVQVAKNISKKGDRILVSGSIRYNTIKDENNEDISVTSIIAKDIMLLGKAARNLSNEENK